MGIDLLLALALSSGAPPADEGGASFAVEKVRVAGFDAAKDGVTLVLAGGRVKAIGPGVAIPAGAERIDGSGLLALPAFLDAFAELALDKESPPLLARNDGVAQDYGRAAWAETAEASRRGLHPELRARELLAPPSGDAWDKLRLAGFGAQLLAPTDGLLAGQACVVELADAPVRRCVVGEPGLLVMKLQGAGGRGRGSRGGDDFGYPSTLMGSLAHLRQAFLDAARLRDWQQLHRRRPDVVERPPDDECLEAIARAQEGALRVAFLVDRESDVRRALAFAQEFRLKALIVGGREAWKCAAELAAARVPVIAGLPFGDEPERKGAKKRKAEEPAKPAEGATGATPPAASDAPPAASDAAPAAKPAAAKPEATDEWEVADAVLAEPLPLFEQRHADWLDDVENVERLLAAGVEVALTQRGCANPGEFFGRLRVAIEHGLAAEAAIAALTSVPARLLGVEGELASLAVGAPASLQLVDGELASKERVVRHVFIGERHWAGPKKKPPEKAPEKSADKKDGDAKEAAKPGEPAPLDLTGTWTLRGEGERGFTSTLTLTQKDGKLRGTLASEMGTADVTSGSLDGETFELVVSAQFQNQKFEFRLNGKATKDELRGKLKTPFGEPVDFTAKRGPGCEEALESGRGDCGCGAHPEGGR